MIENQQEKKVEYLELIYDLIFVYIIGRNNSLLHYLDGGFISWPMFLAYVLGTLAVIQIWNFSTFYINVYGRNSVRDHVFLCINMFLLYFMADGTNPQWQETFYKYTIAWTLIMVNLGIQHVIETRNHKEDPWVIPQLTRKAAILFIEAGLIVIHILVYRATGVSIAYVPVVFGIAAMMISSKHGALVPVDFPHLTERAMLYVVFTFGEMIIAISGYFSGELNFNTIYFAGMAFLIVVGLFLSYGTIYNKLLDREMMTDGVEYMAIHIFLIFALNDLSGALEFMREEEVA
ncbi:MAG: low temperature requirement protein A, partial [Firmicutes bacterium]|nr:low temperature requirement protein A [Bacillota bacterium]